ncbi:unnamed protein product [Amoebophrya sp. A120]|nr:unnamed protein product [Amoebophrya sp. A120]|eukprot:GSA120T00011629001.1
MPSMVGSTQTTSSSFSAVLNSYRKRAQSRSASFSEHDSIEQAPPSVVGDEIRKHMRLLEVPPGWAAAPPPQTGFRGRRNANSRGGSRRSSFDSETSLHGRPPRGIKRRTTRSLELPNDRKVDAMDAVWPAAAGIDDGESDAELHAAMDRLLEERPAKYESLRELSEEESVRRDHWGVTMALYSQASSSSTRIGGNSKQKTKKSSTTSSQEHSHSSSTNAPSSSSSSLSSNTSEVDAAERPSSKQKSRPGTRSSKHGGSSTSQQQQRRKRSNQFATTSIESTSKESDTAKLVAERYSAMVAERTSPKKSEKESISNTAANSTIEAIHRTLANHLHALRPGAPARNRSASPFKKSPRSSSTTGTKRGKKPRPEQIFAADSPIQLEEEDPEKVKEEEEKQRRLANLASCPRGLVPVGEGAGAASETRAATATAGLFSISSFSSGHQEGGIYPTHTFNDSAGATGASVARSPPRTASSATSFAPLGPSFQAGLQLDDAQAAQRRQAQGSWREWVDHMRRATASTPSTSGRLFPAFPRKEYDPEFVQSAFVGGSAYQEFGTSMGEHPAQVEERMRAKKLKQQQKNNENKAQPPDANLVNATLLRQLNKYQNANKKKAKKMEGSKSSSSKTMTSSGAPAATKEASKNLKEQQSGDRVDDATGEGKEKIESNQEFVSPTRSGTAPAPSLRQGNKRSHRLGRGRSEGTSSKVSSRPGTHHGTSYNTEVPPDSPNTVVRGSIEKASLLAKRLLDTKTLRASPESKKNFSTSLLDQLESLESIKKATSSAARAGVDLQLQPEEAEDVEVPRESASMILPRKKRKQGPRPADRLHTQSLILEPTTNSKSSNKLISLAATYGTTFSSTTTGEQRERSVEPLPEKKPLDTAEFVYRMTRAQTAEPMSTEAFQRRLRRFETMSKTKLSNFQDRVSPIKKKPAPAKGKKVTTGGGGAKSTKSRLPKKSPQRAEETEAATAGDNSSFEDQFPAPDGTSADDVLRDHFTTTADEGGVETTISRSPKKKKAFTLTRLDAERSGTPGPVSYPDVSVVGQGHQPDPARPMSMQTGRRVRMDLPKAADRPQTEQTTRSAAAAAPRSPIDIAPSNPLFPVKRSKEQEFWAHSLFASGTERKNSSASTSTSAHASSRISSDSEWSGSEGTNPQLQQQQQQPSSTTSGVDEGETNMRPMTTPGGVSAFERARRQEMGVTSGFGPPPARASRNAAAEWSPIVEEDDEDLRQSGSPVKQKPYNPIPTNYPHRYAKDHGLTSEPTTAARPATSPTKVPAGSRRAVTAPHKEQQLPGFARTRSNANRPTPPPPAPVPWSKSDDFDFPFANGSSYTTTSSSGTSASTHVSSSNPGAPSRVNRPSAVDGVARAEMDRHVEWLNQRKKYQQGEEKRRAEERAKNAAGMKTDHPPPRPGTTPGPSFSTSSFGEQTGMNKPEKTTGAPSTTTAGNPASATTSTSSATSTRGMFKNASFFTHPPPSTAPAGASRNNYSNSSSSPSKTGSGSRNTTGTGTTRPGPPPFLSANSSSLTGLQAGDRESVIKSELKREIIQIRRTSISDKEVRKHGLQLLAKWHPDKNPQNQALATKIFQFAASELKLK